MRLFFAMVSLMIMSIHTYAEQKVHIHQIPGKADVRLIQVEAPLRPSFTIIGDKRCIHNIEYKGVKEKKTYTQVVLPAEGMRHLYEVTMTQPCRAKLHFVWHSSPNDRRTIEDSFMQVDLGEDH